MYVDFSYPLVFLFPFSSASCSQVLDLLCFQSVWDAYLLFSLGHNMCYM